MIRYHHGAWRARATLARMLWSASSRGGRRPRIAPRETPVTTLLYADDAGCSALLEVGLRRLGRHSSTVRSQAEATDLLWDPTWHVEAAFVSLQDDDPEIARFVRAVEDTHPWIRRIAFAEHERICARRRPPREHDMVLWDPWARHNFTSILESAVDCRPGSPRSSWPDRDLFESQFGHDTQAIDEIFGRYRHRIVHLVLDAMHDGPDAEDAVQEICCQIVGRLPGFGRTSSPADWIDAICKNVIEEFRTRRTQRRRALAEAAIDANHA